MTVSELPGSELPSPRGAEAGPGGVRRPDGVTEGLLVRAHPGLCEGWGECHRWAPNVYPLDEDGHIDVHVVEVPPELAVEAWNGAFACPAGVITLVGIVDHSDDNDTPG